jgi:hypothetical protein
MCIVVTQCNNKAQRPGDCSGEVLHLCAWFIDYLIKVLFNVEGIYCLTSLAGNYIWTGEEVTAAYFEADPPHRATF